MKKVILIDRVSEEIHDLLRLIKDGGDISIGRSVDNAIVLWGEEPNSRGENTVSRMHATFSYNAKTDTFTIRDDSINGTWVLRGEEKISLTRGIELGPIRDNDQFYFGMYGPVVYQELEED